MNGNPRPHRRARPFVAVAALAVALAACGSDDAATDSTDAPAGTSADAPSATDAETSASTIVESGESVPSVGFPVSIENMFGTTVVESPPERVVSIGYTEGDFVLALGVTPVAIRDWYGDQPGGLWPWAAASPAADESIEVLQPDDLNFEQIAALDPDLIVAMVSEIEQADYDRLTEIAPVLAQTDEYVKFGMPWDEVQLTIGRALGLEAEAQAIVDELTAQIDEAAAAHPGWAEQTANFVVPAADGTWYAYTDQDNRGRLLTDLGFTIPPQILDLAGDLFYAQGSGENLGLVDADLVTYVTTEQDAVEALPLWQTIPAVADGRSVFVDQGLAGAMSFSTTLSLPYAIENLVPLLEGAIGS